MRIAIGFSLLPFFGVKSQFAVGVAADGDVNPIDIKVLSENGLGQSPGIPGMEFLGRGYDIFLGNPRGSIGSELDPGYRGAVVKLEDSQDGPLTRDKEYLVPFGAQVHSATSCLFESTSKEISSSQQLRSRLKEESSFSTDFSGSFQGDVAGFPFQLSLAIAYSGSERFESFIETTQNSQTTSFEAKAQCNVFDISFEPFYNETTMTNNFLRAVEALPNRFCPFDNENRRQYYDFMDAYGTHVVTNVVLGAKHVYSTVMKSSDVLELKRKDIDIKSSLSVSFQSKFGNKVNQGEEFFSAPPDATRNEQLITLVVTDEAPTACPKSCDSPASISDRYGGTFGFNVNRGTSTSSSNEAINQISQKVETVNEVNIGGRPFRDGDLAGFAESARERPMPIKIELQGIWEFMEKIDKTNEMKSKALFDALLVRRGLDLTAADDDKNSILRALHFGIYRTDAEPIISRTQADPTKPDDVVESNELEYRTLPVTSYSFAPNDNYRTSLAIQYNFNANSSPTQPPELKCIFDEKFDSDDTDSNQKLCANGDGFNSNLESGSFRGKKECPPNYFVCGLEAKYDKRLGGGSIDILGIAAGFRGLLGLELFCCPIDYTSFSSAIRQKLYELTSTTNDKGNLDKNKKFCPRTEFIEKITTAADFEGDKRGITELSFHCTTGGEIEVFKLVNEDGLTDDSRRVTSFAKDGVNYALSGVNPSFSRTSDDTKTGYVNMQLQFNLAERSLPKSTLFYSAVWEGSSVQVSAFFVTMIHGKLGKSPSEDKGLVFFEDELVLSGAYHPFGIISLSQPSYASFGFIDFEVVDIAARMPLLSFLSADNIPDDSMVEQKVIAGVIHPDLYAINEVFGKDNGFTVEGIESTDGVVTLNKARISFSKTDGWASFVVFPLWIDSLEQPSNITDVSVSIHSQGDWGATFNLGAESSQFISDSLGFMFLSLRSIPASTKGVSHGNFFSYTDQAMNDCFRCTFECKSVMNDGEQIGLSVVIKFDEDYRFEALPSVIVTPIESSSANLLETIPTAVVEYVTIKEALVKVFGYKKRANLPPTNLPFNFIAVGPPMQANIEELNKDMLCQ